MSPTFGALGVPDDLSARLSAAGIVEPFPIQSAVIPDALAGRDVTGRAPTGSGKTLAFGLPLVVRLTPAQRRRPTALILAPTRELAEQIATEIRPLARTRRHDVVSVYGGVGYGAQRKALDSGAAVVVACPGRLEDLLTMRALSLQDVTQVVIDEADRMADMGFLPAVRRIVEQTSKDRQVLLFSATLDGAVATLAKAVQRQPIRHEIGPKGPDMTLTSHAFWSVDRADRPELTAKVVAGLGSTMVFCRTRHGADRLAHQLEKLGVRAGADPRRAQPAAARPGPQVVPERVGHGARRHRRRRSRRARRRRRRGRPLRSAGRLLDVRPPLGPHGAGRRVRRGRVVRRARWRARRQEAAARDRHRRAGRRPGHRRAQAQAGRRGVRPGRRRAGRHRPPPPRS